MTIEDLRQALIDELEPAFFVGGHGGAILEVEEIKKATPEELRLHSTRHKEHSRDMFVMVYK